MTERTLEELLDAWAIQVQTLPISHPKVLEARAEIIRRFSPASPSAARKEDENMNVGQLKLLIKDVPDNTQVIAPSFDHYRGVDAKLSTALRDKRGNWTEDHGESLTPEKMYGERTSVLIVD